MKKVFLSVLFSLLGIVSVFSQFDAQFSQYMFNQSAYNPAAVGEGDMIQITGQHRIQWMGMDSTENIGGQITNFSINSPIKINNSRHGIGFRFLNDKVGLFVNQSAYLQYAFKKQLGTGVLSVGADLGFISLGFLGSKVKKITLGNYYNDLLSDPAIPQSDVSGMNFDMNVGVFYSTPTFYSGISFSHLTSPVVSWTDNSEVKVKGSMYLTGGYNYTLPDTKYVLRPSGLFKTDFTTFQLDLSGRIEYDNKYWGGLSYRYQDAVVFLAGINVAGGLSIGYSYDLPTSRIITASWGTHEIVMLYSFEYVFEKRNSKYKSIRIL